MFKSPSGYSRLENYSSSEHNLSNIKHHVELSWADETAHLTIQGRMTLTTAEEGFRGRTLQSVAVPPPTPDDSQSVEGHDENAKTIDTLRNALVNSKESETRDWIDKKSRPTSVKSGNTPLTPGFTQKSLNLIESKPPESTKGKALTIKLSKPENDSWTLVCSPYEPEYTGTDFQLKRLAISKELIWEDFTYIATRPELRGLGWDDSLFLDKKHQAIYREKKSSPEMSDGSFMPGGATASVTDEATREYNREAVEYVRKLLRNEYGDKTTKRAFSVLKEEFGLNFKNGDQALTQRNIRRIYNAVESISKHPKDSKDSILTRLMFSEINSYFCLEGEESMNDCADLVERVYSKKTQKTLNDLIKFLNESQKPLIEFENDCKKDNYKCQRKTEKIPKNIRAREVIEKLYAAEFPHPSRSPAGETPTHSVEVEVHDEPPLASTSTSPVSPLLSARASRSAAATTRTTDKITGQAPPSYQEATGGVKKNDSENDSGPEPQLDGKDIRAMQKRSYIGETADFPRRHRHDPGQKCSIQ